MISEIMKISRFFCLIFIVFFGVNSNVYCVLPYVRAADVYIAANGLQETPNWRIYSDERYKLSLYTVCIEKLEPKIKASTEVSGSEELLAIEDHEYKCIENNETQALEIPNVMVNTVCNNGDSVSIDMLEPASTISCKPGESLAIKVTKINEVGKPSFDKYRYRGILVAEEGVIEEDFEETKNSTYRSTASSLSVKKNIFSTESSERLRPRSGSFSRSSGMLGESRTRSSSNANIKNPLVVNVRSTEDTLIERKNATGVNEVAERSRVTGSPLVEGGRAPMLGVRSMISESPVMGNALGLTVLSMGSPNIKDRGRRSLRKTDERGEKRSPSPIPSRAISPGARDVIEAKKKLQDSGKVNILTKDIPEEEKNKKIRVDIQRSLNWINEATMWIPLKLIFNQGKSGMMTKIINAIFKK